jgi:hypothetical protein
MTLFQKLLFIPAMFVVSIIANTLISALNRQRISVWGSSYIMGFPYTVGSHTEVASSMNRQFIIWCILYITSATIFKFNPLFGAIFCFIFSAYFVLLLIGNIMCGFKCDIALSHIDKDIRKDYKKICRTVNIKTAFSMFLFLTLLAVPRA